MIYIAIDLKSFYASVECVDRGLDPLRTNLVVADESRTEKTICLAVSPSLKSFGIPGRPRLFEVIEKVKLINDDRRRKAPGGKTEGSSVFYTEIKNNPRLRLDYIVAVPRMARYLEVSNRIYSIYLRFVSPEDIHVYSIDEVFINAEPYLKTYNITPEELAMKLVLQVLEETGITATAGIGTNIYLSKIAMDIMAKHMKADRNGVRIAYLDERSYREKLWEHRPITDFWRVGRGYAKKLASKGLYTMGDIARCSAGGRDDYYNEELLYGMFGVNAQLLIDHAWGYESCTMADIKAYKPENTGISTGQVLKEPYDFYKALTVVREMAEELTYRLSAEGFVTKQLVLTVGYDIKNEGYKGSFITDSYGRKIPPHAHGTVNTDSFTSSAKTICGKVTELYRRIVNPELFIRRINISANNILKASEAADREKYRQLSLFTDIKAESIRAEKEENEKNIQNCVLGIRKKYGSSSIIKCSNLLEESNIIERNSQIGGHRA